MKPVAMRPADSVLPAHAVKRTATVTADGPAKVFMLSGDDFNDLLGRNAEFRRHMSSVAGSRKLQME